MDIKKGDQIYVIAGREKGKQGKIEKFSPATQRVVIGGVNLRKRHLKRSQAHPQGGIVEFAAWMSRANVMIICPHCSKTTRVAVEVGTDGKKHRICKHCKGSLDVQ